MPDIEDLRQWLSIESTSAETDELLEQALRASSSRVLSRCYEFDPPGSYPEEVEQGILMQAARLYRRRNSVNGYEGFGDVGFGSVRAIDPDVEQLISRYILFGFA